MRDSSLWNLGCILGGSAVLFGYNMNNCSAFGAHTLRRYVTDISRIKAWETAAHYQMIHSLVILACSNRNIKKYTPYLFISGILCFSGSIYLLVLKPQWKLLGPVTPIGGVLLTAAWFSLIN